MRPIIIAIDGYSGCGKSSTAKEVARRLGFTYVDSGAMYRAVTLYFLRHKVDLTKPEDVNHALAEVSIAFQKNEQGNSLTFLNGENVEDQIREMSVSENVSKVSALSAVRKEMVSQQQLMGRSRGIVMDGRDIGTVVFPDAELKVFLSADLKVRAERRLAELKMKGSEAGLDEIMKNLSDRDKADSSRADSPLVKAAGAVEIDTSGLTFEGQVQQVVELAKKSA